MTQFEKELRKAGYTPSKQPQVPDSNQDTKNSKEIHMGKQQSTQQEEAKKAPPVQSPAEPPAGIEAEMKGETPEPKSEEEQKLEEDFDKIEAQLKEDLAKFQKELEEANKKLEEHENDSTWLPTNRTTVDNIVLGVGVGVTLLGVIALGVYYFAAAATIGVTAAMVMFIIDCAMVLLFGVIATYLAYGIKQVVSELFDGLRSKKEDEEDEKDSNKTESKKESNESSGGQVAAATA